MKRSPRLTTALAAAVGCVLLSRSASAQFQPPSQKLLVTGRSAATWTDGKTSVIQLEGPVKIELDTATLTADRAVIWLAQTPGSVFEDQQAEIALIGDAEFADAKQGVTRSGPRLFVTSTVRGVIRVTADNRVARNLSSSDLFKEASALRTRGAGTPASGSNELPAPEPGNADVSAAAPPGGTSLGASPTTAESTAGRGGGGGGGAGTGPTAGGGGAGVNPGAGIRGPVSFHADVVEQAPTPDNTAALALSGNVTLLQRRENGDYIELLADRIVIFSDIKNDQLKNPGDLAHLGDRITAAYLEGDVRINYTPATSAKPEQRLTANRAYYEFTTDRAILTDAVLHTIEPQTQVPVVVRANKVRQLAQGQYTANHAELSTSAFATPSVSVRAQKVYITQQPDEYGKNDTAFVGNDDTLRFFGLPLFYVPQISGTVNGDDFPLRGLSIDNTKRLGFGVATEWGLFESLGVRKPRDLDAAYQVDYYADRGWGVGLNGRYAGQYGATPDNDKGPTSFEGDFKSYLINDSGTDKFGGDKADVDPNQSIRGRILWEHQQFFPDDWQVQVRAGYVSDPTFLEEYFENEFETGLPHDAEFYVKHQRDTEAITFLGQFDTTNFVTQADQLQEQTDVERLPEVGYHRIGDSFADDNLTFFSDDSAARLRFAKTHANLSPDPVTGVNRYGIYPGFPPALPGSPDFGGIGGANAFGVPAIGYTGTRGGPVYRADGRQEVDWPVAAGEFKLVPYVMGRYTGYTDSPSGSGKNRLMAGTGLRLTTAFWKVDDRAESDLFDVHRVRHIVEPEVNLFTSAATVDRNSLFIYDEGMDAVNDISVAQFALHNTWQTKRGGPGRWRTEDFLTLNVSADVYTNQPNDLNVSDTRGTGPGQSPDPQFRGLFFPSYPEASIPRDSVNGDATWRVTDTTAILSDAQWNVDHQTLATAGAGLAVQRDEYLTYFMGIRYIEPLDSDIASFLITYELTRKYSIEFGQSYDLGASKDATSTVSLFRKFDTFVASFEVFTDNYTGESGVRFNLLPNGVSSSAGDRINNVFSRPQ